MVICAFLILMGHYLLIHKGLCTDPQPLNEHLASEGTSRKTEWVSLLEDAIEAFQALKQACMSTPILAFADYTKDFLLKTDASKEGLGAVLSQNKQMGNITRSPMVADLPLLMKRTIILPNLSSWC